MSSSSRANNNAANSSALATHSALRIAAGVGRTFPESQSSTMECAHLAVPLSAQSRRRQWARNHSEGVRRQGRSSGRLVTEERRDGTLRGRDNAENWNFGNGIGSSRYASLASQAGSVSPALVAFERLVSFCFSSGQWRDVNANAALLREGALEFELRVRFQKGVMFVKTG
nr:hypothetical protein Iba_chr07aCG2810 [Ipomoea batatas]